MKKTCFDHCVLHETDFAETDLTEAVFDHCDLMGAVFDNCNLEKADFRTAYNFTINPEKNNLRKARFSLSGLSGLLVQYELDID
jgi:uncharacterized protein YjbI with pentapeptide repeats